jgi:hypothetical protein
VILFNKCKIVEILNQSGDKGKAIFFRENGQWKAWVTMPRRGQP